MTLNLTDLDSIHLDTGSHRQPEQGFCLMEAVSMFSKEEFTDRPQCVSPFLRGFGISLNDNATDGRRQQLRRFIPMVVGTAGDGLDEQRRWLATDHAVRVSTPRWLDAAGLTDLSAKLRALPDVVDTATYQFARDAIREVRDVTWKMRVARNDRIRAAVKKAVAGKFAQRPAVAAAVAAAAADVAAAAVAVADVAAVAAAAADVAADVVADVAAAAAAAADDPWGVTYEAVHKTVYAKVRAVYEERFGDLTTESWDDALNLYERLILIGQEQGA